MRRRDLLAMAAQTAPALRDQKHKALGRPVKCVDARGRVVRVLSSVEVAERVHARAGIEFDVAPGGKPTHRICERCGIEWALRADGRDLTSRRCSRCRLSPTCEECGEAIVRRRGGRQRCRKCASACRRIERAASCVTCRQPLRWVAAKGRSRPGHWRCMRCEPTTVLTPAQRVALSLKMKGNRNASRPRPCRDCGTTEGVSKSGRLCKPCGRARWQAGVNSSRGLQFGGTLEKTSDRSRIEKSGGRKR